VKLLVVVSSAVFLQTIAC